MDKDELTMIIQQSKSKDLNETEMSLFTWYNPAPVLKLSKNFEWISGNPAAAKLFPFNEASKEHIFSVLPFLHKIDVDTIISKNETKQVECIIGQSIYQFTIIGFSEFNNLNLYGSDITLRKELENKLLQQKKMECIGVLSAGIAHELNTPIQFIGDNTAFVQESIDRLFTLFEEVSTKLSNQSEYLYLKNELPSALNDSIQGIQKISNIVKAMKAFSHPGTYEHKLFDVNNLIENICTISSSEWKYIANLKLQLDSKLPPIEGMENEIGQVILNMIVNSAHAIDAQNQKINRNMGELTISTNQEAEKIIIQINDNGVGISQEILDKIYIPFFTTKDIGKGTGQGLSYAYAVIENHNGEILVESELGSHTTFTIKLSIQ